MYNSYNTTLKVYIIVLMLMNSTTAFYHFYRLKACHRISYISLPSCEIDPQHCTQSNMRSCPMRVVIKY